jgi:SsrA-binding protein
MLVRLDPYRTRKLLLHKKQIEKLAMQKKLENVTFVPLKLYLSKGKVKMLMGVCRGKKLHDKRETEKKREVERKLREY